MRELLFDKWFRKNSLNPISYRDCWNASWEACIKNNAESKHKLEMPVSCKECKVHGCGGYINSSNCKINLIWDYLNKGGNNANI